MKRLNAMLILSVVLIFILSIIYSSCKKKEDVEAKPESKVIYEDDFSSSTWDCFDNESVAACVEDGHLFIEYKNEDLNYFYSYYYYYDFSKDYSIETSIKPIEFTDDFQYGLMFLLKNNYSHYYMYIHKDQFFIGYVYNYNYHMLCDYTYSEQIHVDGTANIIKISKTSKHLDFFINDNKVFECDITNEIGDQFGYKLKGKGKVAIDYFRVY